MRAEVAADNLKFHCTNFRSKQDLQPTKLLKERVWSLNVTQVSIKFIKWRRSQYAVVKLDIEQNSAGIVGDEAHDEVAQIIEFRVFDRHYLPPGRFANSLVVQRPLFT
jgi:hypothetical protein